MAEEAKVGRLSSDVSDVGKFGGGDLHSEGIGIFAGSEFERRGAFEIKNGGVIRGTDIFGYAIFKKTFESTVRKFG